VSEAGEVWLRGMAGEMESGGAESGRAGSRAEEGVRGVQQGVCEGGERLMGAQRSASPACSANPQPPQPSAVRASRAEQNKPSPPRQPAPPNHSPTWRARAPHPLSAHAQEAAGCHCLGNALLLHRPRPRGRQHAHRAHHQASAGLHARARRKLLRAQHQLHAVRGAHMVLQRLQQWAQGGGVCAPQTAARPASAPRCALSAHGPPAPAAVGAGQGCAGDG